MAIIHTNLQDTAAFQNALNTAEAAGASLESAVLQGGSAFSEFDNGTLQATFQSSTQISGFVIGGGNFVIEGSNLLISPFFTVNHVLYMDNSPLANIDVFGSISVNATDPQNPIETGNIDRVQYHSALMDFSMLGIINVQSFSTASTFTATDFSMHVFGPNDIQSSFGGNVIYANGVISGSVSSASLMVNGQYIQATGLDNFAASVMDSNDASTILLTYLGGNDTIFGEGLNQLLQGFAGSDTLNAGAGNDTLDGGAGTDTMIGGQGNDTYVVDNAGDVVTENLNEGSDTVQTAVQVAGNYVLAPNVENLILTGGANLNGAGNTQNNVLTGNSGNNVLDGGDGNDTLVGNSGDDSFLGRAGADQYDGGTGMDTVYYIDASIVGSGGILSGGHIDRIADMLGPVDETRDAVGDTFAGIERLWSLDANVNDSFRGTAADDVIVTGGGDDDLVGRLGADVLDGSDGFDTVWYESIGGTGLVVDWLLPAASTGEAHNDILVGIERIFGAGLNDEFRGGNGNEVLAGGGGDDILDGRLGDDILDGGPGNDIFIGGHGRDVFIGQGGNDRYIVTAPADSLPGNPDIVVGFETGVDKLDLTLARTGPADLYSFTPTSEGSYLNIDLGGDGSVDLMVDVRGIILASDLLW